MGDKISLTDKDWELLIPVTQYKIGETSLALRPVNLEEVADVLKLIEGSKQYFKDHNINSKNYHKPAQLLAITMLVLETIPQIISECTALNVEDVKRLPLEPAVQLVAKLIEINEKSKDGLVKNLTALANRITSLITVGESETLPVSSSKKGTDGKK